jgi:hypothetical protein
MTAPRTVTSARISFPATLAILFTASALISCAGSSPATKAPRPAALSSDGTISNAMFAVVRSGHQVTIIGRQAPSWSATIDAAHGGTIRSFKVPFNGPEIVESDPGKPFAGLFNVHFMSHETPTVTDDRPAEVIAASEKGAEVAKGSLWRPNDNEGRITSIRLHETQVVVEVQGKVGGWRMRGPKNEKVVAFRTVYTFDHGTILCDGEIKWIYPHGTRLEGMALAQSFAPEVINLPVMVVFDHNDRLPMPLTTNAGVEFFHETMKYPLLFEVDLKNGYRLTVRPMELPPQFDGTRRVTFERPWQREGSPLLALRAGTKGGTMPFPVNQPIRFKHALSITYPTYPKPLVTISPAQKYVPGQPLQLSARAIDPSEGVLPGDRIEWEIFNKADRKVAPLGKAQGSRVSFVVPAEFNGEFLTAVARVSNPRKLYGALPAEAVMKLDPLYPPKPAKP